MNMRSRSGRAAAVLAVPLTLALAPVALGEGHAPARGRSAPPAAPNPADAARRAQPLATWTGGQLTVGELEDNVAQQTPFMRNRYREPKALQELEERMLRFELLAAEAERAKWGERKQVTEAVSQSAVQTMMRIEFDENFTTDSIPKQDVEAYYKAHIDDYVQPAMQRVSHVLVPTEAEAKALLPEALKMDVRAFRQLAHEKSIDEATKNQGGDLHYFDQKGNVRGENAGPVPASIIKAAFGIKTVGDTLNKPVKVATGYSILKLTGSKPALSRKLPEVEQTIRAKLWRERREERIDAFVASLRERYQPEVHAELIDLIKLDPVAEPGVGVATAAPGAAHGDEHVPEGQQAAGAGAAQPH